MNEDVDEGMKVEGMNKLWSWILLKVKVYPNGECANVSWLKSSTTSLGLLGEVVVFCCLDFEYWVVLNYGEGKSVSECCYADNECVVSGGSQQSVSWAAQPMPRGSRRGPDQWPWMCVLMRKMGQAIHHTNKSQRNYFLNDPVNSYKHFKFPKSLLVISLWLVDIWSPTFITWSEERQFCITPRRIKENKKLADHT